jgi:predicted RNase H-like HicB family nuclease
MAEEPLRVEVEQEEDGRWIAEVVTLPGVLAYGQNHADPLTALRQRVEPAAR